MALSRSGTVSEKLDDDLPLNAPGIPLKSVPSVTVLQNSDTSSDRSQVSTDDTIGNAPQTKFGLASSLRTSWAFELLASMLSLIAFIALIVVLKHYDRRAQKEWPYNHLTLNGLVAVLSTICRAALLVPVATALSQGKWIWYSRSTTGKPLQDLKVLDDASRGALGSIQLLWRMKGRHLVSFGAALTILALAFDTFSQQVLSVEFRSIVDTDSSAAASVPRSEVYNNSLNGRGRSSPIAMADLPMQASIFTGLLTRDIASLPVYCPTGNCTWPVIPSLGMCGGCTDVSSDLRHNCNSTHCTYSLPSNNSVTGVASSGSNSTTAPGQVFAVMNSKGTVYKPSGAGYPLYVMNFEAIGVDWWIREAPNGLNPNASDVKGTECALWFCVQAYNVSVTHGRQFQRTLGTWSKATNLTFTDIPPEFNVPSNVHFTVSNAAYQGLFLVLTGLINEGASVSLDRGQNKYSHDAMQAIWEGSQGWPKFIDNLALSLSNTIRSTAPANNATLDRLQYYAGTAYANASFVRVRWQWLAFPALMVVASVLLLTLSVWQTGRSRIIGWKSNPLALLLADVDEELVRKAERAMGVGDLKDAVGREKVLLERNRVGRWHFRRPSG